MSTFVPRRFSHGWPFGPVIIEPPSTPLARMGEPEPAPEPTEDDLAAARLRAQRRRWEAERDQKVGQPNRTKQLAEQRAALLAKPSRRKAAW